MSPTDLEQLLRDLPSAGIKVKDRGYRQIWRFEFQGRPYYLKFYPRTASRLKRLVLGSPALREFSRLQALQKAKIAAPRAVAHLSGYSLLGKLGDAVVIEGIEPAVSLDRYVNQFLLEAQPIPDRRHISQEILQLLNQLTSAGLGHNDLHLGNMLLKEGKIHLLDGYAVRPGGLKYEHLLQLAHSVGGGIASRIDLQRGWNEAGPGGSMPKYNPVSQRQWRKFMERTGGENDYFGKLQFGEWRGIFFKRYKFPRRWAPVSQIEVAAEDWQREWPRLWERIESDQLDVLKRSRSGDVLAGQIVLAGHPIDVVVKRPFKRYWYRYINEIGRGDRAWRAWRKAWNLVIRDLPTAWPLMVLWKRQWGYVTDALIVFERLPGATLGQIDLDSLPAERRDMLFRRTGEILRKIEEFGFSHFDAKASNWIVQEDPILGPRPILIDVDGIRFRRWRALGIQRLLRSMREHPQYTPADSLALCQGYSPFSTVAIRSEGSEPIAEPTTEAAESDETH